MLFSDFEKKIITDKEFLSAKIKIIDKIQNLFEEVRKELKLTCKSSGFYFPDNVDINLGKIFKGENYRELPYVVLDYPKLFSKDSVFAFRTMFWWGNFFSLTLHLQGKSLFDFRAKLISAENELLDKNLFVCVGSGPWEYHYENNNYQPLTKETFSILKEHTFLKLSQKFSLDEADNLPFLAKDNLNLYLNLLLR